MLALLQRSQFHSFQLWKTKPWNSHCTAADPPSLLTSSFAQHRSAAPAAPKLLIPATSCRHHPVSLLCDTISWCFEQIIFLSTSNNNLKSKKSEFSNASFECFNPKAKFLPIHYFTTASLASPLHCGWQLQLQKVVEVLTCSQGFTI